MMSLSNKRFRPALLSAAIAASVTSVGVFAQEDASTSLEEITVTGFRKSLQDSMSLKADSDSIVEAISAEDIGKLPDNSIAEALARMPGLTAQRLNGRAQVISVRGLAPDFTTALLNGREQVSAGDNRGVEFDQYPSELINQVVVYKTPDASLLGQGLAGTADLRTINPLEHGERTVSLNTRYVWSDIDALNAGTEDAGERASVTYIDQFAEDTIGVALAFSHNRTPNQINKFEAWGYEGGIADGGDALSGGKLQALSNELDRQAVAGIIEFQPNDQLHTKVELFYSDFAENQRNGFLEMPFASWSGASLEPGYTLENGVLVDGQFNDVFAVIRNDFNTRDADLLTAAWATEYKLNDVWTAKVDVSHSSVDRDDMYLETYSGTGVTWNGADRDNIGFTLTDSGPRLSSTLDYTDTSLIGLTDPGGWGQVGFNKFHSIEDELNQLEVALERELDLPFASAVEFGAASSSREKSKFADEFIIRGFQNGEEKVDIPVAVGVTDLGNFGISGMVGYNALDVWNSGIYVIEEFVHPDVTVKGWTVEEDVTTLFAKFDFSTELAGLPLTGNYGVQAIYTEQSSTANVTDSNNNIAEITRGSDYWEYLPSVNMTLSLSDNDFARLGIARTMARPRMDDLRASQQFGFDAAKIGSTDLNESPWSANGGNPELDPWIANAFDLSYERYFDDAAGYVALAAFYKDLESYIYKENVVQDFTGYPVEGVEPALYQGYAERPVNGDGGEIYGVEFSLNLSGEVIAPQLAAFGATLNASHTQSSIESNPGDPDTPLPGLSEDVANITLYYENNGFSGRVSSRYRSDFLGEVTGFGASRDLKMIQAETVTDAQVSYAFDDGQLAGLTLLLQANNITDEPFVRTEDGNETKVLEHQVYGRTFMLGASYKF